MIRIACARAPAQHLRVTKYQRFLKSKSKQYRYSFTAYPDQSIQAIQTVEFVFFSKSFLLPQYGTRVRALQECRPEKSKYNQDAVAVKNTLRYGQNPTGDLPPKDLFPFTVSRLGGSLRAATPVHPPIISLLRPRGFTGLAAGPDLHRFSRSHSVKLFFSYVFLSLRRRFAL